jgi:phosphoribosylformylglycinamidine cyclo-ligase
MGHRMELYTSEKNASQIISISKQFNIDAQIIGRVEASSKKQVTVKSTRGTFQYF